MNDKTAILERNIAKFSSHVAALKRAVRFWEALLARRPEHAFYQRRAALERGYLASAEARLAELHATIH